MRFDDRLTTVLAQPADDAHDRAVRWRQLVELLARGRGNLDSEAAQRALEEVREQASSIPERLRAAAARAVSGLKLPTELIAVFASDVLAVAAPVLAAAALTDEEWGRVHDAASAEAQAFITNLQPGLFGDGARPPGRVSQPVSPSLPESAPPGGQPIPSISDLVARIERMRRTRRPDDSRPATARGIRSDAQSGQFRWEALPSGEIGWVEGVPRGAVVGRSLAAGAEDGFDPRVERAFALRAPFREAPFLLAREGPLAGTWRLSGVPAFEPSDGRFAGYRGIAIKDAVARPPSASVEPAELPDHDSLRELVHEIKTPLNAIMGFAEIIERQYLGPADRRYRSRAGEIIAQARVLLEAIDDLDFAAKLQAVGAELGPAADLASILSGLSEEMQAAAAAKGVTLRFEVDGSAACAVNGELGRRLIRRFCLALIDAAVAREEFVIQLQSEKQLCRLSSDLPGSLQALDQRSLFAEDQPAAVWLRLLRGLVQIAGGELLAADRRLILGLPRTAAVG